MKCRTAGIVAIAVLAAFTSYALAHPEPPEFGPGSLDAVAMTRSEIDRLERELAEMEKQYKQREGTLSDVHPEQAALRTSMAKARRQMDDAQRRFWEAQVRLKSQQPRMDDALARIALVANVQQSGISTLIVPARRLEPEQLEAINEDMAIMGHILQRAMREEFGDEYQPVSGEGPFSFTRGSAVPQGIYLDGYGALFLLGVKFPLVPAPAPQEQQETEEPRTDWERARRELYGGGRSGFGGGYGVPAPSQMMDPGMMGPAMMDMDMGGMGGFLPTFGPDRVERLHEVLFRVLPQAANIRELGPEDTVAVAVLGASGGNTAGRSRAISIARGGRSTGSRTGGFEFEQMFVDPVDLTSGSVTTVTTTKGDIARFASGELSAEEFQARLTVATYAVPLMPGLPHALHLMAPEPPRAPEPPAAPGMR